MAETILISAADYRPVNFRAFEFMLNSLRQTGNHLFFDRIAVIHPSKNFPSDFIDYLRNNGVEPHGFDTDLSEDTYKIKLLLAEFIASCPCRDTFVFYLDPDHLFLDELNLAAFPRTFGTLFVSSEVSPTKNAPYLKQNFGLDTFFNTSIIFGTVDTWSLILPPWIEIYHAICALVPSRHREEIAFSIAAQVTGITVRPVSRFFQSNFTLFTEQCRMFHYGGESPHTRQIKTHLASNSSHGIDTGSPVPAELRWMRQLMEDNRIQI